MGQPREKSLVLDYELSLFRSVVRDAKNGRVNPGSETRAVRVTQDGLGEKGTTRRLVQTERTLLHFKTGLAKYFLYKRQYLGKTVIVYYQYKV